MKHCDGPGLWAGDRSSFPSMYQACAYFFQVGLHNLYLFFLGKDHQIRDLYKATSGPVVNTSYLENEKENAAIA
jgi:hypothetical protein